MNFLSKIQARYEATAANYSVHIELNEEGSSDYLFEVVLPKKIVEGLAMLPPRKLNELKKLLKEAFTKAALSNDV